MENIVHATVLSLIDEYRNLFSMLGIMLVFALRLFPLRPGRRWRTALAVLMLIAFGFLARWSAAGMRNLTEQTAIYAAIGGWYVFVITVAIGLIAFLFQAGIAELAWLLLTSYAVHHLVYVLVTEILFTGLLKEYYSYYGMLCAYIPAAVLIYLLIYRLFRPILADSAFLSPEQGSHSYVTAISIFLVIFVGSTFVNMHNALAGTVFNYLAAVSDLSNCLFVITDNAAVVNKWITLAKAIYGGTDLMLVYNTAKLPKAVSGSDEGVTALKRAAKHILWTIADASPRREAHVDEGFDGWKATQIGVNVLTLGSGLLCLILYFVGRIRKEKA